MPSEAALPAPAPVVPDSPEAVAGSAEVPDAQLGNPDGAWLRVLSRTASPIHLTDTADDEPRTGEQPVATQVDDAAASVGSGWAASTTPPPTESSPAVAAPITPANPTSGVAPMKPDVVPARRRPTRAPMGTTVVGGRTVKMHRVVALDRLASGVGYLTVEWLVRQRGLDLLALQDGSSVSPRGNTLTIDLTQPMNRVLIATGTQGTLPLAPSELRVSNGSTQIIVPIDGGTSLGVWPRLTLTRVDEFVVIRHEHDALSGILTAVAGAYGYDERSFVITHTHLLG